LDRSKRREEVKSIHPKTTVLKFNDCINNRDLAGLSSLMPENHTFIDRAGTVVRGKDKMTRGWKDFFESFPDYKNTFERIEVRGGLVVVRGFAVWKKGGDPDCVIWTAVVDNGLVAEWRIYEDTEDNRKKYGFF
jgi:ketosteroid isomerase-like protein